jgi:Ion transport protein
LCHPQGILLDFFTPGTTNALPILRVFRVLRVIKLIPRARGLHQIMMTIYFSLPMLANIGAVFILVIFIFVSLKALCRSLLLLTIILCSSQSIIAMNLFGSVKFQSSIYAPYSNFNTWPNSMLLLFRMTAMENWNGVMIDCVSHAAQPCCDVPPHFHSLMLVFRWSKSNAST